MSRGERGGSAALFRDYGRISGARLWLGALLMLLGAIAEGFGLLMIVPLASIAIDGTSVIPGRFAGLAAAIPANSRFAATLALFLGTMAARSALLFARDMLRARLQSDYESSLRLRAAATLANRGWTFASGIDQAAMQSLLLNDVPRAVSAVGNGQDFAVGAVMVAVQLCLTALLSPTLTLFALAIMIPGFVLLQRSTRRVAHSGEAIVEHNESSTGAGFRLHAGLKSALAQGTVPQFLGEYGASLRRVRDETLRFFANFNATHHAAGLGAAVAAALLLFVGTHVLALPFPVLAASLVLFARMSAPSIALQQAAQQVAVFAPSFTAIERRLGQLEPPHSARVDRAPLDWRELRLERVRFAHRTGRGLSDASLTLGRGQWIGIAGSSAAGKTTLLDLIAGLIAPQVGTITVDGEALVGTTLEQWRGGLAYVGQDGALFDDSVRANLLADGSAASEDELWNALARCGLEERVRTFSEGLDQAVGDRGSLLSGGERQRLMIARALLRRPTLLILDEATAAIDAGAEAQLIAGLRALEPRPAALVVAHRDSTLAHCDSVVTIQHGRVEKAR